MSPRANPRTSPSPGTVNCVLKLEGICLFENHASAAAIGPPYVPILKHQNSQNSSRPPRSFFFVTLTSPSPLFRRCSSHDGSDLWKATFRRNQPKITDIELQNPSPLIRYQDRGHTQCLTPKDSQKRRGTKNNGLCKELARRAAPDERQWGLEAVDAPIPPKICLQTVLPFDFRSCDDEAGGLHGPWQGSVIITVRQGSRLAQPTVSVALGLDIAGDGPTHDPYAEQ